MKSIELPILCHDQTSRSLEEIGIKYNLTECETKPMSFYHITCITPYVEGDFTGTHIFCGNSMFVSPLSYEQVVSKMDFL